MTPQEEAARIAAELVAKGFSQTDIARALGLTSRGSGSYVGQILRGRKGAGKVAELRQLAEAAARAGRIPVGRKADAAAERRRILAQAQVQRTPRQRKGGGTAAVRRAATKVSRRGFVQAFAGAQSLATSGGKPVEDVVRALAQYPGGRVAFRVVGRFLDKNSPAFRSKYWRQYYGKKRGRKGPKNVLEASFGNRGRGFAAADWASFIDAEGAFLGALRTWMESNGYDVPDVIIRVEVTGWVE